MQLHRTTVDGYLKVQMEMLKWCGVFPVDWSVKLKPHLEDWMQLWARMDTFQRTSNKTTIPSHEEGSIKVAHFLGFYRGTHKRWTGTWMGKTWTFFFFLHTEAHKSDEFGINKFLIKPNLLEGVAAITAGVQVRSEIKRSRAGHECK